MTTLELHPDAVNTAHVDELIEMLLRVARRADVLARKFKPGREADRRLWLRAEFEMFERAENARPAAGIAHSVTAR